MCFKTRISDIKAAMKVKNLNFNTIVLSQGFTVQGFITIAVNKLQNETLILSCRFTTGCLTRKKNSKQHLTSEPMEL